MGWYRVTKTIGGRAYVYAQRTYREGGKVRTENRYIGPASAAAGTGEAPRSQMPAARPKTAIPADEAVIIDEVITTTNAPSRDASSPIDDYTETRTLKQHIKQPSYTLPLHLRFNAERYNISGRGLTAEHERVTKRMQMMGLVTEQLPPIVLNVSAKVGMRRRRLRGGYVVTMARHVRPGTGGRNAFRREYRKALAHRWLDQIEQQRPLYFEVIRTEMNDAYRHAKWEMTKFILNSSLKGKLAITLHILWTGQMPPTLRKRYDPQSFGMMDDDRRRGWRDDAAKVIGEVIQRGYPETVARTAQRWKKADSAVRRAEREFRMMGGVSDFLSGRKRQQLRKIKMLRARRDTIFQHARKIRALYRMWHQLEA